MDADQVYKRRVRTKYKTRSKHEVKTYFQGISCSRRMAENDNNRTRTYRQQFRGAGSSKSIDHCILGAISSRESRSGNALTTWNGEYGWGDCYGGTCYGFGLMQIDRRYHSKVGAWNSQAHIEQGLDS